MNINIDNLNINYEVYGEDKDSDISVVLLHGWASNMKCFTQIINTIKEKYKTYAIDLPGHGESDELKRSFNVDDYKNVVIDFIKNMGIKKVILIGHSYGGRIIIKLNSEENLPFEINKNILIDAAGIKKNDLKKKIRVMSYKLAKKFLNLIKDEEIREEKLEKLKRKYGSADYATATPIMRETLVKSVNEDLTPYLNNMRETLLIWGDKDMATPIENARLMEKKIKNAGLVVLKGTGHFSFIEDSYTFDKVIRSYLKI